MKFLKSILLAFILLFTFSSSFTVYGGNCSDCHTTCENNSAATPAQINSCKQYCNQYDTRCTDGNNKSNSVSGGNNNNELSTNIDTPSQSFFQFTSLDQFFPNLIQVSLILGSLLALVWLFWGGIELIIGGGNQEKTKGAKEKISQALFGLAALTTVWTLWRIIIYFLGISSTAKGPFNILIPSP